MKMSKPFAIQNILLACDNLEASQQPVTVDSVWQWLAKEWEYEYPRDLIEQTIGERDLYVWNVRKYGYEKAQL